ncbi:DapH/DapD/GlmU-related protein [Photobacterium leiognathi]|uniref:DapH/DapD/GlmU-related protein n=1 Tax=Photobacterium leiognathi TaxID=553611 RepID=UPI002738E739|nr:DapH/DapD/GlmU-related protein [Photobacterium leiognathi]
MINFRFLLRKIYGLHRKILILFRYIFFNKITCNRFDIFHESNIKIIQKIRVDGLGHISINSNSQLGVYPSPNFYNGEFYLEARNITSRINIGANVFINNNARIIADKSSIDIGDYTLIGPNFFCTDSNFHSLSPKDRLSSSYKCSPINIGNNVFIGDSVSVLKGVSIGDNSVIGAGCIIDFDVPANTIVSRDNTSYKLTLIRD